VGWLTWITGTAAPETPPPPPRAFLAPGQLTAWVLGLLLLLALVAVSSSRALTPGGAGRTRGPSRTGGTRGACGPSRSYGPRVPVAPTNGPLKPCGALGAGGAGFTAFYDKTPNAIASGRRTRGTPERVLAEVA
jgi:hypothetical protein